MDNLNGSDNNMSNMNNNNMYGNNGFDNNMYGNNGFDNNMYGNNSYGNNMNGMNNGGYPNRQRRQPVKRTSNGAIVTIILAFIGIFVIGIVGMFVFTYVLVTKEAKKISTETFTSVCKENELEVTSAQTDQEYATGLVESSSAFDREDDYVLSFYVFDNDVHATDVYQKQRNLMETEKGGVGGHTEGNFKNQSFYSTTANGKYRYVTYVDNTVLYVEGSMTDKEDMKEIVDELGY